MDEDGFGAEMAFCKLCNLYPDFSIGIRSGGHDCELGTKKIDVKQTHYPNGRLLGYIKKKVTECDINVLMIGRLPTFEYIGWVLSEDLIKKENISNLGHGQTYALEQNQTNNSLEALKSFCKE